MLRCLTNTFIKSQISYCPSIRIFNSGGMEHRINRIHKVPSDLYTLAIPY